MNPIRSLLLGMVAAVGGMALIALFMPSAYHTRTQVLIDRPAKVIFQQINTLPHWQNWAFAGYNLQADSIFQFAGPEDGVGALLLWNQEGSQGRLEIVRSLPDSAVYLQMNTNHGEFEAAVIFRLQQADSTHTVVTCEEIGDVGYKLVARYFVALGGLEKAQTRKYQAGLDGLKALCESEQ